VQRFDREDQRHRHALSAYVALRAAGVEAGYLKLAPAFDVLPSGQGLGYQQMRVGAQMADSTVAKTAIEQLARQIDRPFLCGQREVAPSEPAQRPV
jgi:hypothetical protein